MTHQDSETTRLAEYSAQVLPWAPGHQLKGSTPFVGALIEKQTGTQAALARSLGNQEAGVKRLARLLHNERLAPQRLADAGLAQALRQVPPTGKVRVALDGTREGTQHRLGVALVRGGRAVPPSWRAYPATVVTGRLRRYELAGIRRAVRRVRRGIGQRRLRVTADRGFAAVALGDVLPELGVEFILRLQGSTQGGVQGQGRPRPTGGFVGNARHRTLGRGAAWERAPPRVGVTRSRVRDAQGQGERWPLIAKCGRRAQAMATE